MVCRWGMSDVIGPVSYHETQDPMYMGGPALRPRMCSEAMAVKIDEEITRIVSDGYQKAEQLLSESRGNLQRMAEALLKYEVLYAEDVDKILAGEEITRDPADETEAKEETASEEGADPPETPDADPKPREAW